MKEILGVIIVLLAIIAFLAVFRFVKKKGTYKGNFLMHENSVSS